MGKIEGEKGSCRNYIHTIDPRVPRVPIGYINECGVKACQKLSSCLKREKN